MVGGGGGTGTKLFNKQTLRRETETDRQRGKTLLRIALWGAKDCESQD